MNETRAMVPRSAPDYMEPILVWRWWNVVEVFDTIAVGLRAGAPSLLFFFGLLGSAFQPMTECSVANLLNRI